MRDPDAILDDISAAAELGDNDPLDALIIELGPNILVYTALPDATFRKVKALLEDDRFRSLDDSWRLAYLIDGNWELLTNGQREELRPVLASIFDRHHNNMGAFVIGEIFGRQYCDEGALDALLRLSKTVQTPALALVPHGLETFARNTSDRRLRDRAVQRIRELTNSPVDQVRQEAAVSLGKIGRG